MRFPVKGDEEYVKTRVKMLVGQGYKALNKPKRIESASLTVMPKFIVMMEGEDKKQQRT